MERFHAAPVLDHFVAVKPQTLYPYLIKTGRKPLLASVQSAGRKSPKTEQRMKERKIRPDRVQCFDPTIGRDNAIVNQANEMSGPLRRNSFVHRGPSILQLDWLGGGQAQKGYVSNLF